MSLHPDRVIRRGFWVTVSAFSRLPQALVLSDYGRLSFLVLRVLSHRRGLNTINHVMRRDHIHPLLDL
jgi:hypothetical protein